MRIPLAVLALTLLSAPARAWEADASGVEERLSRRPSPRDSLQLSKPDWARRIDGPEDKVHWEESHKGKIYVFGVGMARDIDNPGLRLTAAEDRARASIVDRVGDVRADTVALADGRKLVIKTAVLNGSQILDWYLDRSGDLYALAVFVQ